MSQPNLNELMKKAQEMQQQMQKDKEALNNTEVTGESGAGLVKITMTGAHDVNKVTIDASVLKEDKEILEDLIAAAINDAVRKVGEISQSSMSKMTSGLNLPEGFNPFG